MLRFVVMIGTIRIICYSGLHNFFAQGFIIADKPGNFRFTILDLRFWEDLFPPTPSTDYLQPFDFGDITITSLSVDVVSGCTEGKTPFMQVGDVLMRGIVDFKYEVIE